MAEINIKDMLASYDKKNLTIATVCSHSSLQIFHGAKKEGFKTLGIALKKVPKFYDAFPLAKPDEFLVVEDYKQIRDHIPEMIKKNVIIIPHGSFVEYLGATEFAELPIPTYGNRAVLEWECGLKHPEDGAREGAEFISKQIIRVTEKTFDDFAGGKADQKAVNIMLGLDK